MVVECKAAPVIGNTQTKEQIVTKMWLVGPVVRREQMVIDMLYGVNEDMPGLEILLDEEGKICKATKEDKSLGSSS